MASTEPRPKTTPVADRDGASSRRGPRRAPAVPVADGGDHRSRGPANGPQGLDRRTPQRRRPRRGRPRLRPGGRGPRRPAAGDRGALRHPSDRQRPDPGRPRHRPGGDPGRAAARRPRGHRVQPDRRRGALRRRGRAARRRGDQAVALQHTQPRAAAGREHPEDAAGDGPGHPGRPHQARRPPAQHAHALRPAVGKAGPNRPPDHGESTRRWPSGSASGR